MNPGLIRNIECEDLEFTAFKRKFLLFLYANPLIKTEYIEYFTYISKYSSVIPKYLFLIDYIYRDYALSTTLMESDFTINTSHKHALTSSFYYLYLLIVHKETKKNFNEIIKSIEQPNHIPRIFYSLKGLYLDDEKKDKFGLGINIQSHILFMHMKDGTNSFIQKYTDMYSEINDFFINLLLENLYSDFHPGLCKESEFIFLYMNIFLQTFLKNNNYAIGVYDL